MARRHHEAGRAANSSQASAGRPFIKSSRKAFFSFDPVVFSSYWSQPGASRIRLYVASNSETWSWVSLGIGQGL